MWTEVRGVAGRSLMALLVTAMGILGAPALVEAQSPDELPSPCAPDPALLARCAELQLAARALGTGLTLAQTGGSPLPGAASTLGRRFARTPRWALAARTGFTRFDLPDIRSGTVPSEANGVTATTIEGTMAIGVLEGFSPQPTVGGVLAIDVLGKVGKTFVSEGEGFDGNPNHFGYGVRVGVFRESFTLPGVSISAMRVHSGKVELSGGLNGLGSAEVESTTTSIRGTVGKDFMAIGVLAGMGWDRISSEGLLRAGALLGAVNPADVVTQFKDLKTDRTLFFVGLSRTVLVAQMALEAGWAQGQDARATGFDPSTGPLWASFSLRLTF